MVSVIVTVHNSEQYLRRCLDSVCNQTYKDIEIICLDGGSKDKSPEILKEYAKVDNRIRIINDSNTSYGHKVNVGIERSLGDYVSVLESDDEYEPDMIEKLMEVYIKHPEVDYVNGEYREFWDVGEKRYYMEHRLYNKQPYNCVIDNTTSDRKLEIMDRYWTGVYKKGFIIRNNIKLNESPGASYQDSSFCFLLSVLAEKCYHINDYVYRYRMDNINSSIKDSSKIMTVVYERNFLKGELDRRHICDRDIWYENYRLKYLDFYGTMTNILTEEGQAILYDATLVELKKDLCNMPEYSDDKYPHTNLIEMNDREQYLKKISAQYKKNAQSRNNKMKMFNIVPQSNCYIIFGCGIRGRRYRKSLMEYDNNMPVFIDNDSSLIGKNIDGKKVISPEEAVGQYPDAIYVVANATHEDEMVEQLIGLGVSKEKIL